ncbi:hypothetical protein VE03_09025 [Pseudogymnoascus sp. 23342-1-I1]|nr:hypothetical protein VE03_09025 [Pseudogymnoascus sp. 23342-1-I1]
MWLIPTTVPPKRTIKDVDPADREAVKKIRLQTFHSGATIDECLNAYLKHQAVDPAVQFLMEEHERKEVVRFKEHIQAAAAKTLYEAAGLPEPSASDKPVKLGWKFAEDMDLDEDHMEEQRFEQSFDAARIGSLPTGKDKQPATSQDQSTVMKYFSPSTTVARDVFGRTIDEPRTFQRFAKSDKTAATFKANAILRAAFKQHPRENMDRELPPQFRRFWHSNPLNFKQFYEESLDRFGRPTLTMLMKAYPATTHNKIFKGVIQKLNSPAEDGTAKLVIMSVCAMPLWSGKNGIHHTPDRTVRSVKLNTLSPEEIRLGDYYRNKFCSTAPHQFQYFLDLPLHLQDLIWEFSFEERVVEIHYDPKMLKIWSPTRLPPQGLACKESNAIMRRLYERSPFGAATDRRGLLFNFDIDIMFLTFEKMNARYRNAPGFGHIPIRLVNQLKVAEKFLRTLPPTVLAKIRHLGIDRDIWEKLQYDMESLRRRRHKAYGQERFLIPLLPALESLTIIENLNFGRWRMNKRRGVVDEELTDTRLVAMRCQAGDIQLDDFTTRLDVGQLVIGSMEQLRGEGAPDWFNYDPGVTFKEMMDESEAAEYL